MGELFSVSEPDALQGNNNILGVIMKLKWDNIEVFSPL